jgi:ABC-2 type transport system ATP-binding protein
MSISFEKAGGGYRKRAVFRNVTFALEGGRVMGLLGPNGAGKTTLLRMAAGLIRPSEGRVLCDGAVMYFGGEMTIPGGCRADRWSRQLGTSSAETQRLRRLSRGTRQLIGLHAVLGTDHWGVGLLDEPWEGLDPEGARWLRETLQAHRRRGSAIIVSSHRLHDVADACDTYAFLAKGELRVVENAGVAGRPVDAASLMTLFDDIARQP